MKMDCDVIRDLLPLYLEGIASEGSCKLIEEHISCCESCKAVLEQMRKITSIPMQTDVKPLLNVRTRIRKKIVLSVVSAFLLTMTFFVGAFICAVVPVRMTAEEAIVSVEQEENGRVRIQLSDKTKALYMGENFICYDRMRLNWFVNDYREQMIEARGHYFYFDPKEGESLWYLGIYTGDEDTLLWGDGVQQPEFGYRSWIDDTLVCAVYVCVALGLAFLLVGILLRKKTVGKTCLAVAALLLCCVAACLFVTDGYLLAQPSRGINWRLGTNELQYIAIAAMTFISYLTVLAVYFTVRIYRES